jgi:hypothetical protein
MYTIYTHILTLCRPRDRAFVLADSHEDALSVWDYMGEVVCTNILVYNIS